jgi:hypothetical protein
MRHAQRVGACWGHLVCGYREHAAGLALHLVALYLLQVALSPLVVSSAVLQQIGLPLARRLAPQPLLLAVLQAARLLLPQELVRPLARLSSGSCLAHQWRQGAG